MGLLLAGASTYMHWIQLGAMIVGLDCSQNWTWVLNEVLTRHCLSTRMSNGTLSLFHHASLSAVVKPFMRAEGREMLPMAGLATRCYKH